MPLQMADKLFESGKFAGALEAYRIAKPRAREAHEAIFLGRHMRLRISICLDHLRQWDEAAIGYLVLADNRQQATHFTPCMEACCRLAEMYKQAGREAELHSLLEDYAKVALAMERVGPSRGEYGQQSTEQFFQRSKMELVTAWLESPATILVESNIDVCLRSLPVVPRATVLPTSCLATSVFFAVPLESADVLIPQRLVFDYARYLLIERQPDTNAFAKFVMRRVRVVSRGWEIIDVERQFVDAASPLIFADSSVYVSRKDGSTYPVRTIKVEYEPDDRLGERRLVAPNGETNCLFVSKREVENFQLFVLSVSPSKK